MPATIERHAPPAPDHRPSDEDLYHIAYGHPSEPDEIVYRTPAGSFFTSREERARAHRMWQNEGRTHRPTTPDDLARTERMLRFRSKHMGEEEPAETHQAIAAYAEQLGHLAAQTTPETPQTDRYDEPTGEFPALQHDNEQQQAETAYVGRHRRRGMRVPLRRIIGHLGYRSRHVHSAQKLQ